MKKEEEKKKKERRKRQALVEAAESTRTSLKVLFCSVRKRMKIKNGGDLFSS